jgi:hypothetical protein
MGGVAITGTQEDIRPQAEQEPGSAVEERPSYDHLFNPDHTSGSVDDARVETPESEFDKLNKARRGEDEKYNFSRETERLGDKGN